MPLVPQKSKENLMEIFPVFSQTICRYALAFWTWLQLFLDSRQINIYQ